jgi:hypothetical protein
MPHDDRPFPGCWRRDDGRGSFEFFHWRRRWPAQGFTVEQLHHDRRRRKGMQEMQIIVGQTGVFQATLVPVGSALQKDAVPVWTVDDPNVTLTPSADGLTVSAATVATDTATTFNLTITGINSAGATISDTAAVALVQPAPVPATGFTIAQLS